VSSPGEYLLDAQANAQMRLPFVKAETRQDSWTVQPEGRKNDGGKDRWDLLPIDAIRQFVKVLTFGARKYTDRNWEKGIHFSRCYAALLRHITSWWEGEDKDPETGLSHLAHAGACILFLLAFTLRGRKDLDDRPLGGGTS
jgi:hypothetical protein